MRKMKGDGSEMVIECNRGVLKGGMERARDQREKVTMSPASLGLGLGLGWTGLDGLGEGKSEEGKREGGKEGRSKREKPRPIGQMT